MHAHLPTSVVALMSELARALRRGDWLRAYAILREAGLSERQAGSLILEEYDRQAGESSRC